MPNKQLYNGGSEWQNDYGNLPDYYQTYNRNYDAALARFIGVDPEPESAESLSSYHYAGNNPIMMNDPLGNEPPQRVVTAMSSIMHAAAMRMTTYESTWQMDNGNAGWYNGGDNDQDLSSGGYEMGSSNIRNYIIIEDGGEKYYRDDHESITDAKGVDIGNMYTDWIITLNMDKVKADSKSVGEDAVIGGENIGAVSKFLWFFGSTASAIQNFYGSNRFGTDLVLRTANTSGRMFTGNQYVQTWELAKIGRIAGYAGFALGELADYRGYQIYRQNPNDPNAVSPKKFGLDTGMGLYGLTGAGTIPAIGYFALDAFYPGGVKGYMNDYTHTVPSNAPDISLGW